MSANSSPAKTFRYKVYNSAGVYQGDLKGIESDPTYTWNINDAGPQMVITLDKPADSFGEGTLVAFRNKIQVYAIDIEAPTGTLIFQGFISNWTPIYAPGAEKVQITALSYGYELSQIYLQNFSSNTNYNTTINIIDKPPSGGRVAYAAQLFKTGPAQTQITAVDLLLDGNSQNMNINIYTVNVSTPNTPNTGSLVGTITKNVPNVTPGIYHFDTSSSPITVSPNTQYWFTVDDSGPAGNFNIAWNTNSNTYPLGQAAIFDAVANAWTNYTTRTLYFIIYPSSQLKSPLRALMSARSFKKCWIIMPSKAAR
jgi:hypothetical protein